MEMQKEKTEYKSNQQGNCPKCNSENLGYDTNLDTGSGDTICYEYTCGDCGFNGQEWYNLQFAGHYDSEGVEINLEVVS